MRTTKEYIDSIHRYGRFAAVSALAAMLATPIVIGAIYGVLPDPLALFKASAGLLLIFVPIAVSEVFSYTPVLGSSIYLTLITGNVLNMKLPVAMNALRIMDVEQGTEAGDVVSAIAVGVSSLVTLVIMTLGAILMVPLRPILTLPAVRIASSFILPALFGGLLVGILGNDVGGGVIIKGRLKAAIVPALIVAALFLVSEQIMQLQGVLIILMLPVTYFGAKLLYKRGKITVVLPTDSSPADVVKEPTAV